MKISIPDFALVVMIGPTGSGKSSLAHRLFLPSEIISSDGCRAIVSDDETAQTATADAFDLLQYTAAIRLKRRKLTVIDATSVRREDRAQLIALARRWHALPVALVLDIDPNLCHERNITRPNRQFALRVPQNHSREMRRGLKSLGKEGFRHVHVLKSPEEADALEIAREPLWTDRRADHGPFDIIGDVHGCFDELGQLLGQLGYVIDPFETAPRCLSDRGEQRNGTEELIRARHPEGRVALFLGDLMDRGPRNLDVLRLVMGMTEEGTARAVMGNHDAKLLRWLRGSNVNRSHGLDMTIAELEATSEAFRRQVAKFIDSLRSHLWLDGGKLVAAHAGLKEEMHGRGSGAVRSFAMFGDTTGEVDEFGLPVRLDWARDYRGKAVVVYGHTPTHEAEWLNETICIDTGCVFGGKLTALRWPERQLVSVAAAREYMAPAKPFPAASGPTAQQDNDRMLFFDDYIAKHRVETRSGYGVWIPAENAAAALEVASRFAVDPRWMIYLPPTMAPCSTAADGPFLEHPVQALDYYAGHGVTDLVAEEKHMGSRALLVVARDAGAARARFGVEDGKAGVIYTRTGRPFFKDDSMEAEVIARIGAALGAAGLWDVLSSDWVLLDAEMMPWSAKAQALLQHQYGPTVAAAKASAAALLDAIDGGRQIEGLDALKTTAEARLANATRMGHTIAGYCWDAPAVDDYRIAPFHLLAAEGHVFSDRPHDWHMETLKALAGHDPILRATTWRRLDAASEPSREAFTDWWLEHTGAGGEGMVIKPVSFIAKGGRGFVQPAMKVRGREYLRIIYGPDYDLPENIERLRARGLSRKFSLAQREFALGLEGLARFVERQPLRKVHECALAVLALESEPVDPRL